jgi:hypothetical protein
LVLQEYTSAYARKELVNIVDWESSSEEVQAALLQAAINLTLDRELTIWSVSLARQVTTALAKKRFKLEPQPESAAQHRRPLLVRPIRNFGHNSDWRFAGQSLREMKNWDLRMLYSMHG